MRLSAEKDPRSESERARELDKLLQTCIKEIKTSSICISLSSRGRVVSLVSSFCTGNSEERYTRVFSQIDVSLCVLHLYDLAVNLKKAPNISGTDLLNGLK